MESVLRCEPATLISDRDASALWGYDRELGARVHLSVPAWARTRPGGLVIHRRGIDLSKEARIKDFIPVTSAALTLIDNAERWGDQRLEAMVNMANGMRIANPNLVRQTAGLHSRVRGAARVARVLDRLTFALTDSELERIFRRLLASAGLPQPLTQQRVNGCRVDFFWPELGLVVEADSLRHHGTAMVQRDDRRRDRTHTVAGLQTLRFTHYEINYEGDAVLRDLTAVIDRRRRELGASSSIARLGRGGQGQPR